jgi:hypothetical protein
MVLQYYSAGFTGDLFSAAGTLFFYPGDFDITADIYAAVTGDIAAYIGSPPSDYQYGCYFRPYIYALGINVSKSDTYEGNPSRYRLGALSIAYNNFVNATWFIQTEKQGFPGSYFSIIPAPGTVPLDGADLPTTELVDDIYSAGNIISGIIQVTGESVGYSDQVIVYNRGMTDYRLIVTYQISRNNLNPSSSNLIVVPV